MDRLCADQAAYTIIRDLEPDLLEALVRVIGFSQFLFNLCIRHPEYIHCIGKPLSTNTAELSDLDQLRLYKYRELLKITSLDLSLACPYINILSGLSQLAVDVINQAVRILPGGQEAAKSLTILALGKLGANELNFSSDIDLIYVTVNPGDSISEYQELQQQLIKFIRLLNSSLEQRTPEGFLYRVDQKLRPWGSSGPLCMCLDDTENYYAAVSEPWERFAWLRACRIAGSTVIGDELMEGMRPFVYRRALDAEDLVKFVRIKNDMDKARRRKGHWNVKVGEGGIRDIEFFVQVLQIVNAGTNERLQSTNTVSVMAELCRAGHITETEHDELLDSYLFLRRLENHLQMLDERQTHDLPDDKGRRHVIARSMMPHATSEQQALDNFEDNLIACQATAKMYFDRILPGDRAVE